MPRDSLDLLTWIALVVSAVALVALFVSGVGHDRASEAATGVDQALQRQLAHQAKLDFIKRIYAPVEELRRDGKSQQALLKLEEIGRDYPGEAYGQILRGELLLGQGALQEALASVVAGVKANGDYIDRNSPLQRRELVTRLVKAGREQLLPKARSNPDNRGLARALDNVHYLQSRLAGGCE